ncbi:hypothetical protein Rhe02_58040 [Rhizocola hellebori]|uniref:Lactococcin 972 family bacteriocin n=1 Tax=Rhizocola hellebori TaxID=1392758 RepID=A0A8J3VIT6_9ACTN|nr:lactococcin 972 family bacteriocin [Rhizocola hellebori]GIH07737.1 hypothetical protein Rhe02_58040 [Rhizocola hellebori]
MSPKKAIATGLAAAAMVLAAAVPALATVVNVGGGTWNYGVQNQGGTVWSNFQQPSRRHRSSVINGYGEYYNSGCKAAGVWSYASLRADPNHTDHSYWSVDSCN